MTIAQNKRSPEEAAVAIECCKIIGDLRRNGFWSKTDAAGNYVRDQSLLRAELELRAAFGLGAE